jgi:hypothetical protein
LAEDIVAPINLDEQESFLARVNIKDCVRKVCYACVINHALFKDTSGIQPSLEV